MAKTASPQHGWPAEVLETLRRPYSMSLHLSADIGLNAVSAALLGLDPNGSQTARLLRETLDQLYDGQRTGRYAWDQLYGTERRKGGALVEINMQREFRFQDGAQLSYTIASEDVDCKYSPTFGGWMIPPEAHGLICLLLWADDLAARWSLGVVRATADRLNTCGNRGRKATLNREGRAAIVWIFDHAPLPPNVLLQLDRAKVDRIMALNSGVQKVNELFRIAQKMRVGRAVVATVGEQVDYMRRIRYNGGARGYLQPEGIIILGQYQSHVAVAKALEIPAPGPGESVSVRVCPATVLAHGVAEINGELWRVAEANDPVVPALILPEI